MKKTILNTVCAFALGLVFSGCMTSTGFIQVDKHTAAQNGIVITHVEDNPFFTTIEYDYSSIENFTTNAIEVTLVHNFVPDDPMEYLTYYSDDYNATVHKVDYCNPWGAYMRNMQQLTTVEGINITKLPNRPAIIWKNEPGKLVIASFDDIGTYQICYNNEVK